MIFICLYNNSYIFNFAEIRMYVKEKSRKDIEMRLDSMGDYMKMGYLAACLKNPIDLDTRKFVLIRLAGLYEVRGMFLDAGKMIRAAAGINTTYQAKITDFVKACELFIRAGDYEQADSCMMRAIAIANEKQKEEIRRSVKESYKVWGRYYLENSKRKQAISLYERLWSFDLGEDEKQDVKKRLLDLYNQLGKIREYNILKNSY
jgi:tetratricopeptide (TPR) repeat protein